MCRQSLKLLMTFTNFVFRFGKGERESVCHVVIIDDSLHEDDESFNVVLSYPMGGALGQKSNITITILPDLNDGENLCCAFTRQTQTYSQILVCKDVGFGCILGLERKFCKPYFTCTFHEFYAGLVNKISMKSDHNHVVFYFDLQVIVLPM